MVALAAAAFFWMSHGKPSEQTKTNPPKIEEQKIPQPPEPKPRTQTPTGFMRLVPGGDFLSGPDKKTEHLGPYYIDETEVSNQAYASFCTATQRKLPKGFDAAHPQLPVVNVTIAEAREFAAWAGKRLPNSKEWEKAARGPNGLTYPWGGEKDPSRANVADNGTLKEHALRPVDDFPRSASPYQVVNMIGNVWEFVDERVTPEADVLKAFAGVLSPAPTAAEPWVMTRGGFYGTALDPKLTWDFQPVPERFHFGVIGFRCVMDVK